MFDQTQSAFIELKKILAENTAPVYVWIGAGLSMDAGFPSWNGLRAQMVKAGREVLSRHEDSSELRHSLKLLEVAECDQNLWKAFDHIREAMGPTEYERCLVSIFQNANRCQIPEKYKKVFDLNIKGVVTTNIDRLSTRAYWSSKLGSTSNGLLKEFYGLECNSYAYVLASMDFFILHLHGYCENTNSLIMRSGDLENLSNNNGYKNFIRTLFFGRVMVFVGVNPVDQSIIQHLNLVRREGASGAPMYWITDRKDKEAATFSDRYGIRQIFYSSENEHRELVDVLGLLAKSESDEESLSKPGISNIPMIQRSVRNLETIDFSQKTSAEIRDLLNKKASEILRPGTEACYKEYECFLKKFRREIHNCWYLETGEKLFGLTIGDELDDGAFGRVFRAEDDKGNIVAVKLLKSDLMRKPECVQSFRRGVRAMEILARNKIPGVAQYKFASEIPAFVAMEYIEGENLHSIVEKKRLITWQEKMKVLTETAKIIKLAHSLPERVLHRDIRPQNIMLKGYDYSSDNWSVSVLDFDLAFHKGANEVSMQMANSMNGYLAPEQTDRSGKFGTTRSSRVDSYGFAMLCYYVITGKAPRPDQCFQAGWGKRVFTEVCAKRCNEWVSLPFVMSRIINQCTNCDQNARMDLYKVYEYLNVLNKSLDNCCSVQMPDLLIDELGCLIAQGVGCENQIDIDKAQHRVIQCMSGQSFQIYCEKEIIRVETSWHDSGMIEYSKIKKRLKDRSEALVTRLRRVGFSNASSRSEVAGVVVELSININIFSHERMKELANVFSRYQIFPQTKY